MSALKLCVLDQLARDRRAGTDGDDLVVVTVHDEGGNVDPLEVVGEVGLAEGLDAVVGRFQPPHHPLPPPVIDQALN